MNFWPAFEMLWPPPWTDASHFLDLVGNAAPLIAFCAYLVKDIIWLRARPSPSRANRSRT
jgi:hypothetical protein